VSILVDPLHEIEEAEGEDAGASAGAADGNAVDGSALLAGTGGDAYTNPPWLQTLYASLSEQLATSLAASEDSARARLEQQAADQHARATAQQQQLDHALQSFAQQQAAFVAQSAPDPPFSASVNADVSAQLQAQALRDASAAASPANAAGAALPRDDASITGSAASA
jgi:hypothetical protein